MCPTETKGCLSLLDIQFKINIKRLFTTYVYEFKHTRYANGLETCFFQRYCAEWKTIIVLIWHLFRDCLCKGMYNFEISFSTLTARALETYIMEMSNLCIFLIYKYNQWINKVRVSILYYLLFINVYANYAIVYFLLFTLNIKSIMQ